MRNVLIISPHFPPINAADMHRARHSLPYFRDMGWNPIVLAVEPDEVEGYRDELLPRTIPAYSDVRHVSALSKSWTQSVGIGSVALRSLPFYLRAGSRIIARKDIDLVYFSTTMFPVLILGRYWKFRFGVPYVIDMQDPWFTGHHWDRPVEDLSLKTRAAHEMDRLMEPIAMKGTDAVISVSQGYCDALQGQYANIRPENCTVLPFAASQADFDVLDEADVGNPFFSRSSDDAIHIVQVGRAGRDMELAARSLFSALAKGLEKHPQLYDRIQMHFIGTRYAPPGEGTKTVEPIAEVYGVDGEGTKTVEPIAEVYGVGNQVTEMTDRVPYFQSLQILQDADMLVLLGSEDPKYTASKLYPYILARRPLLAIFHQNSSVIDIMERTEAGIPVSFSSVTVDPENLGSRIERMWTPMLETLPYVPDVDWEAFQPYTAETMTRRQVEVFDRVIASS